MSFWCSKMKKFLKFFFIRVFFHRHWRFTEQQGKGGHHLLFHSITSTRSRTLRHLFPTLHVRWLSRLFNRNACVYKTVTRWDFQPYQISAWLIDWLIDDAMFVCVFDELILGFCYSGLTWETGGFELVSTITRVLQANRLSKCASHPNYPRKNQIYLMQVYMFRSNQIKFENPKS